MNNDIGNRIKTIRRQRDITQEELGNVIGVTKATINKYETGIVANLKRTTIEKLAIALDVSASYLMGWDESQNVKVDKVQSNNGIIGQTNAPVTIHGNGTTQLNKEESELLRIYRELDVKSRMKLLTTAIELEEKL